MLFFFSSRRRHTRCALVTGVQTCALPIYVAFAPRMGPWRDRSILAPARRPWRRDSVIVFGNLAVGRSAREHAPDLGDELRVDLAADLLGAGDDASFTVEQHQCAGVVELAIGRAHVCTPVTNAQLVCTLLL